jgi:carboxyl-terminal processing protease
MRMKRRLTVGILLVLVMLMTSLPMLACDTKFIPGEADKKVLQGLPPEFLSISQAWDLVQKNYVDKTKLDPVKMAQGAIRGMVEAIGDPYTEYFSPQSLESTMADYTGLYQGIGAYIGKKDKQIVIIAPMPGSPAEAAGLIAGDMILKINGESTAQMNTE